jgi:signal transduction histidine kinase
VSRSLVSKPSPSAGDAPHQSPELEAAMERFAGISRDLLGSYAALSARAERVERELVHSNAELARRVAELDAVLEALPTGVLVRDGEGRVLRQNRAAAALLDGASELDPRCTADLAAADAQGECRLEWTAADGGRRVVQSRSAPIRTAAGLDTGSVQILDDQTEREALARRAQLSEKLAAVGTLAAGIAHEVRNPLNATKGFAALLERNLAGDAKLGRWAHLAGLGCQEVESIVSGLLHVAEPGRLELSTIEPRELADEVLARCEATAGAELRAVVSAPPFLADRIQLRQALRNLVQNAIDAQPAAPRVELRLEVDGDQLLARVGDAGPGVPAELRERVLEPFFTTRAAGTGLGLALCHTIARLHGGRLELSETPSALGGAEFLLRLPLHRPGTAA